MTAPAGPPQRRIPPLAWLLILVTVCLLPFINKAVHLDDTLFLRAAEQIQKHPGDFYGFTINWYGEPMPMTEVFENPPLTCYYLALAASLLGWSEPALHLAMLLPALAAIWGIYSLARFHCRDAVVAAMLSALTPVFLISATTLMCDVMLLAFWIWAMVLLETGWARQSRLAFVGSGVLAGLAVLTKFTGLALVPLIVAYALVRTRRPGWWLAAALIPLAFAGGYEWFTHGLYGRGLFFEAAKYAAGTRDASGAGLIGKVAVGLSFAGGCFLPLTMVLVWNWPRAFKWKLLAVVLPVSLGLPFAASFKEWLWLGEKFHPIFYLQAALFVAAGMMVLFPVCAEAWRKKDSVSVLLWLWVMGIFVFATLVNWTTNGRSLLPMLPALVITVARHLEIRAATATAGLWRQFWPALPAGVFGILLVLVDYQFADVGREVAREVVRQHQKPGKPLSFQGHWGFQYYMEKLGARAMSVNFTNLIQSELAVLPALDVNTGIQDVPTNWVRLIDAKYYQTNAHFAVMSTSAGAGFYASIMGPLPFAFGRRIRPERYYVFEVITSPGPNPKLPDDLEQTGALMQQWYRERKAFR